MENSLSSEFSKIPQNSCAATKRVMDLLLDGICPVLRRLRYKLQSFSDLENEVEIAKIKNVYMLCSSQIKKCMVNFLDIIKMENKHKIQLQESRKFIFERLTWCITKLTDVENNLDKCKRKENIRQDFSEDPMFATPMYFVNWIDYTFEILAKLAEDVYRTDYKDDKTLLELWKEGMVDHITSLHMCIDELLLSAMTLCKYCLSEDQTVLRARCQVVLRETKALFNELIDEDISAAVKVTKDKLKLPIKPSNVNMMMDVLKDVLYVLETNTNTALLALLISCYVNCASPVEVLQDHFIKSKHHFCSCNFTSEELVDKIENCDVVKYFDMYNERLQQIGSFAMSCSSDQKRILTLRSCLSSLESLDPHLVPSVSTSPNGHHTELLANFWKQEVLEIRDTVFLIVDPVAFVEKCKQYMHDILLEKQREQCYDNRDLWVVMNTGCIVYDFFTVYKKYEPEAIAQYEELDEQLQSLFRVQRECKKVSELLTKKGTFLYDPQASLGRYEVSLDTLITRVKLLYSIVKRVHELIRPKDVDEQLFEEDEVLYDMHVTHVITNGVHTNSYINTKTFTNRPRKTQPNLTRSIFARSSIKTSTKNLFLSKLTKHIQLKKNAQEELSFSAQVSELFKDKEEKKPAPRERSPPMLSGKYSLRRIILSTQREYPFMRKLEKSFYDQFYGRNRTEENQESVLVGTESLQISEILHQINDLTTIISPRNKDSRTKAKAPNVSTEDNDVAEQALSDDAASTSNISNATQPSNFTTLERINDLDLVESKLNSLRTNSDFETHL